MLYPLKFLPIYKDKIWGGQKIKTLLDKNFGRLKNCGESWEISGVQNNLSVVSNGFLKGNNLEELIDVYMSDLVGEKTYEKFGIEFPLLIKFIDASEALSIQVHPADDLALKRHRAYGKTEMWYILQADNGAEIITGFNQKVNKTIYERHLENNTLTDILNVEETKAGDVFFLPAGRVHAIGAGILLAEIQQTSDITYRIFDWNRLDDSGNPRELHTELAMDAIDYNYYNNYKTVYKSGLNKTNNIISCRYFTTNIIRFDKPVEKEYFNIDSFVIYMCINGEFEIRYDGDEPVHLAKGETALIPAILKKITFIPKTNSEILEIFIS